MNYLDIEVGIDASEEVQVVEQEPVEAVLQSHYRQVCRNYIAIVATWELIFNLIRYTEELRVLTRVTNSETFFCQTITVHKHQKSPSQAM